MGDDFRIGGRLEQGSPAHQIAVQRVGVGEISVMCDGEAAELEIGEQRLDIAQGRLAGRRIAAMTEGGMQPIQVSDEELKALVAYIKSLK
jgi:hypothetical protein